jgi:cell division protein FtsL
MTIEIITFILICALALVLSLYHHRQAASLRAIESVAQDYFAMQFRSIRREYAGALDTLDSFAWVSAWADENRLK